MNVRNNELTEIDVSNNTELLHLSLNENDLTSLNVNNNTKLETLTFQFNQISEIDISNNIYLEFFVCDHNLLTNIDLSSNVLLDFIWCFSNQFTYLDFSNNPLLEKINCKFNENLTYINLKNGNNINLDLSFCDFSNLPNLETVCVDDIDYDILTNFILNEVGHSVIFSEYCILGIEDNNNISFTIYPNPTQDFLFIESLQQIETVIIYSLQGQLIKEGTRNSIDVSHLNPGLYFIQVVIEGKTITKKFIKK